MVGAIKDKEANFLKKLASPQGGAGVPCCVCSLYLGGKKLVTFGARLPWCRVAHTFNFPNKLTDSPPLKCFSINTSKFLTLYLAPCHL